MRDTLTPILEEAEEFASKILKNEVSEKMTYHNYDHTQQVVNMAARICEEMKVSAEEREIVLLAAWFHDLGYCNGGLRHEEQSRDIAVKFLEERNYSKDKIERVSSCIMATQMPQNPKDQLGQILCDSDLSHLGSEGYLKKSELLRQEIELVKGQKLDKLAWLSINKAFLEGHCFFTEYAKSWFGKGITENLKLVETEISKASRPKLYGRYKGQHHDFYKRHYFIGSGEFVSQKSGRVPSSNDSFAYLNQRVPHHYSVCHFGYQAKCVERKVYPRGY